MKMFQEDQVVWGEWQEKQKTMFVDSAGAHTGSDVSNFALAKTKTTLRNFPVNATHLLQALDVLIMRPLKRIHFQRKWSKYCMENTK